jgi:hypothetical protein
VNRFPLPNYRPSICYRPLNTNKLLAFALMSHSRLTAASASNFQQVFDNALKAYETRTKKDLLTHPLAPQLQACNSPNAILAVLRQGLDQSQSCDDRWTKWLDPTINVLFTFSATAGAGVGMVCPRTGAYRGSSFSFFYLSGILARECHFCRNWRSPFCVYPQLLAVGRCNTYIYQAAKDVRASQDTLVDIFQHIESFFRRLEMYTEVRPTTDMVDLFVEIMVEVISILGIATEEIRKGRLSE